MPSKEPARSHDRIPAPEQPRPPGVRGFESVGADIQPVIAIPHAGLDPLWLTPDHVLQLQHTVGNHAVHRLLAGVLRVGTKVDRSDGHQDRPPGKSPTGPVEGLMAEERGATGLTVMRQEEKTDPGTIDPTRQKLQALNIRDEEIGTPETLEDAEHYVGVLEGLFKKYPGIADILVRRWNNRADDLGIAKDEKQKKSKPYGSVLHYLKELDRLALASLGVTWDKAIPILSSPKYQISLAGARFTVHPRALYFVAAAQVGMDIAAKKAAGEGHYIAPAALYSEVYSVYDAASTVVALSVSGGAPEKPGQVLPLKDAAAIYANVRGRLAYIDKVVTAQQKAAEAEAAGAAATEPLAEYHHEPALVAFFAKKEDLKTLPAAAGTDAEAVLLCKKIVDTLKLEAPKPKPKGKPKKKRTPAAPGETLPKKVAGHGAWSFDPHSTPHALAVAIDLFTDRVSAVTNMNAPEAARPFLNYLIQTYGAAYDLDPQKGYKGLSLELARLLRDKGKAELDKLGEAALAADPKAMAKTIYLFDTKRNQLRKALQKRATLIKAVLTKKWPAPAGYRDQLAVIKLLFSTKGISDVVQASPAAMVEKIKSLNALLEKAAAAFPLPEGGAELSGPVKKAYAQIQSAQPGAEPSLTTQAEDISAMAEQAQAALTARKILTVKKTATPSVKKWITTVSKLSSSAFDQPAEVIAGVKGVKGARLMGAHHWEIGAFQVPKEAKKPGTGLDKTFKTALDLWAAAKKVNLSDLLDKVKAVEPKKKKMNPKVAKLIQDLYSRGYHELAKKLESAQTAAGPGRGG